MTRQELIDQTKRQLADPKISPCRKRDLTKFLWRLQKGQKDGRNGRTVERDRTAEEGK